MVRLPSFIPSFSTKGKGLWKNSVPITRRAYNSMSRHFFLNISSLPPYLFDRYHELLDLKITASEAEYEAAERRFEQDVRKHRAETRDSPED